MSLNDVMKQLIIKIGQGIDSLQAKTGNLGDDIADSLCHRFADKGKLYDENGEYPEWLRWIVVGVLIKKGITKL